MEDSASSGSPPPHPNSDSVWGWRERSPPPRCGRGDQGSEVACFAPRHAAVGQSCAQAGAGLSARVSCPARTGRRPGTVPVGGGGFSLPVPAACPSSLCQAPRAGGGDAPGVRSLAEGQCEGARARWLLGRPAAGRGTRCPRPAGSSFPVLPPAAPGGCPGPHPGLRRPFPGALSDSAGRAVAQEARGCGDAGTRGRGQRRGQAHRVGRAVGWRPSVLPRVNEPGPEQGSGAGSAGEPVPA